MNCRLIAMVADGPNGRTYVSPDEEHEQLALSLVAPENVPDAEINGDMRYLTPVTYGMTRSIHRSSGQSVPLAIW